MSRVIGVAFAALFSLSTAAQAADLQMVVAGSPEAMRAKLIEAAAKVCDAARAQDPFGDFGTQQECIENAISGARVIRSADQARPVLAARWATAIRQVFASE